MNELILENLLNLFASMPGLEKEKKNAQKPLEKTDQNVKEEDKEMENEILEGLKQKQEVKSETIIQVKLFLLNEETLTSNSKVTDIDIHRKLFNDSLVNFLKNKVTKQIRQLFALQLVLIKLLRFYN
jgi:hypothetical protein